MKQILWRRLVVLLLVTVAGAAAPLALAGQRAPVPGVTRGDTTRALPNLGTIDGIVSDTNLAPIRGAFVSILSSKIRVGTGPNGRFRITRVPPGPYLVIVKRAGYHPVSSVVEVPSTDTVRLSYTLTESAITLAPMVATEKEVSARMRDFESRKRFGLGEFMTREEIEKRNPVFATELFRKFGTINVGPSHSTSVAEYFALSKREGGTVGLGACPMTVYLDQVPLPTPFNLDLLPPPKDLAGIEVYAGSATIPPQFNGYNRGCGVILVWTKDGY